MNKLNWRRFAWPVSLLVMVVILAWWGRAILVQERSNQTGSQTGRRLRSENYPQVKRGMSRAAVEALLGGPPGEYGRDNSKYYGMELESSFAQGGTFGTYREWTENNTLIEIHFGYDGRVLEHYKRNRYKQLPPLSIRAWLKRWLLE